MSWNDDDTWEHMQYGPFLLLCDFLLWNKFTLLCFLKPFTLEQIDTNKNCPPILICPKRSPGVPLASILHISFLLVTYSTKDHHRITLPHHQVITWPPRIKLLFFDMFFNVSGTFDTLNEPVLKIYEAKIEIWKCTWKGSALCSYLSPALPFPVSRTRNHFTEGTFVKL